MTPDPHGLRQAWVDIAGRRWYRDADGHLYANGTEDGAIARDGLTVAWPDGPGIATLTERRDLWAELRAVLNSYPYPMSASLHTALSNLISAHDRGEL